jgi:hypothetical protein
MAKGSELERIAGAIRDHAGYGRTLDESALLLMWAASIEEQAALLRQALELLRELEWETELQGDYTNDYCPLCQNYKSHGHADGCRLAAFLAGPIPEPGEDHSGDANKMIVAIGSTRPICGGCANLGTPACYPRNAEDGACREFKAPTCGEAVVKDSLTADNAPTCGECSHRGSTYGSCQRDGSFVAADAAACSKFKRRTT